jgi:nitrogen-specific signal transduction histidine kinase
VVRNERGEAIGFAKIVRDVTERRRAQEALERTRDALAISQKMETVGQLTGGVAHDFNNILAVILGSLELAKKRLQPEDPRIHRLLDNAIQGAHRGASLTQRMLAFARKQDLKPVVVDVPELVRGMAALLKFDPGIRVETRFPIELANVKVDANQLELAILNLAVNARDAIAADGGVISISAREEHAIDGLAEGRYVALSVSDTGCGMGEETLKHAQEPFFTTKGVGKGTGLGLSMVKGLAEQSGGVLLLKSHIGEGTTAEIWLPACQDEKVQVPHAAEPSRSASRSSRPISVLVVDDDLLVLDSIAAMLDDLGHAVIEARSGEEAVRLLPRMPKIDIVVTDYAMPGMNGFEFAQRVKERNPKLPIILATGYAELPADRSIEFGHLSKPYTSKDLAEALEKAVM